MKQALVSEWKETPNESIKISNLEEVLNKNNKDLFERNELESILQELEKDNKVMYRGGKIVRI